MGTGQLQKGLETAAVLPRVPIPGLLAAPSQVQTEEGLRLSVKQAQSHYRTWPPHHTVAHRGLREGECGAWRTRDFYLHL